MTLPSKGLRRIVVDGTSYVWHVRRRPTYAQAIAVSPMTAAVQLASGGRPLHVVLPAPRSDNWLGKPGGVVTPRHVRSWIAEARERGWKPEAQGRAFRLVIE